MTLHVALTHRTSYQYDRAVTLGPQVIRLRPAPHARTPIVSYALRIEPAKHFLNWQQDPQGNMLARAVFPDPVTRFVVTVDLVADMATINPFDFFLEPSAETWPFDYDPSLAAELAPFRVLAPGGPLFDAFVAAVPRAPRNTVDALVALNGAVRDRVDYIVRMEQGVLSPERCLSDGRGSCRDSAWLLVQAMRHLGLAARFVSGYLIQLKPDVVPLDGPPGPTADFTDLHAWAEIYLPGAGWVGLDATSGLLTGEGHIPLAATPEPSSAAPISGLVGTAETVFDVSMSVTRIRETPRVTSPYDEATWAAIDAAGHAVDRRLASGDVRLTMGGEPTFVARDDQEGAEWNGEALGPTKRRLSGRLIRRLATLWAPGAAIQYAAGKHYPGEQLPRWALHAHWRHDGEPVWRDPALLASDDDHGDADETDAASFAAALAERLQVDPERVLQAHEDVHYYLWREYRLPGNVLAEDAKLGDPLARARLARVFGRGVSRPAGSVLPLRRVADGAAGRRWQTGRWLLRSDLLFLVPGDSAIGFRLPLESLPWADPDTVEIPTERDPFAPRPAFARRSPYDLLRRSSAAGGRGRDGGIGTGDAASGEPPDRSSGRRQPMLPGGPLEPGPGVDAFRPPGERGDHALAVGRGEPALVRTALTVEARGGTLHVFFPPLTEVEDWLDLATAVEETAAERGCQVVLEGYLPPRDPRLGTFSVTPDPGVIEVNVPPASSWGELTARHAQLYAETRASGLAAEKFMLDGRHVGTGGGNHVVMGAAEAADSPFLRRPDLLRSLLGFWHNHPSLSFLFSGLFIGPTSQHPRIDEARDDAVGELEIAFAELERCRETPPWLVDRLFRNILADMTGNTHRTEFCIDKLYSPEGTSGRLGLVEFRSTEMPPHEQMAAVQALLVRAAVAAFWEQPYTHRLVRWGTRLHDDFMLPHYVRQDFAEVLDALRVRGVALDPAWFEPHLAFRFPIVGAVDLRGVGLELRHALEPWHALGEVAGIGGTVRMVDSSVERLQVRVTGWIPERYVLGCNGRAVELSPTERAGEYVAGVRFKAWSPPASLHPTIRAQTPLVFDIHDRWTGRSLGGITHHVAHPGGRNYETFPVNAGEAEARRRSRFFPFGHSPGQTAPPRPSVSPDRPRTLDLRRG